MPAWPAARPQRHPIWRSGFAAGHPAFVPGPRFLCGAGVMSFPLRIDPGPPMLHVSLFVELLRSRPRFMMWAATLAQAALWGSSRYFSIPLRRAISR